MSTKEISNQEKAFRLLLRGKAVHNEKCDCYIKKDGDAFFIFRKVDGSMITQNVLLSTIYRGSDWQLYEEPKFRETDFNEAFEAFENGKKVMIDDFELRYTLSLGRHCLCLFKEKKTDLFEDNMNDLTSYYTSRKEWRIYETE